MRRTHGEQRSYTVNPMDTAPVISPMDVSMLIRGGGVINNNLFGFSPLTLRALWGSTVPITDCLVSPPHEAGLSPTPWSLAQCPAHSRSLSSLMVRGQAELGKQLLPWPGHLIGLSWVARVAAGSRLLHPLLGHPAQQARANRKVAPLTLHLCPGGQHPLWHVCVCVCVYGWVTAVWLAWTLGNS